MSLWIKVFTSFYSHRKTIRLQRKLGFDALWLPPRLWAYCAENQPDGNLADYSPEELARLLGYNKNAKAMVQGMIEAAFLDDNPLRIHDWDVHNNYHGVYADRAKKAAQARWKKDEIRGDQDEKRGEEMSKHCSSIPSSNASSTTKSAGAAPTSQSDSDSEWIAELKASPAYEGIDVDREWGKMIVHSKVNKKQPTRRRFVAWLNRIDRPLQAPGNPLTHAIPKHVAGVQGAEAFGI